MRIPLLKYASSAGRRFFSSTPGNVKPVTHCIFDMDGLLIDSETVYKKMLTILCKKYGHEYTNDLMMKILGGTEWRMAETLVKELALPMTPSQLRDEFLDLGDKMLNDAPWMPGAEKLLRHLHKSNVPIACATSSSERTVKVKIQGREEVFGYFNHWVMGSTDPAVKFGKPHPDIFLIAAERFPDKPDPSKCLVFEDSPHGVTAANSACMQSVMVPDPELDPKLTTGATIVLPSLECFKPETFGLPPYCD